MLLKGHARKFSGAEKKFDVEVMFFRPVFYLLVAIYNAGINHVSETTGR